MPAVATHTIRVFGDPVLKRPTAEVTDIDGGLVTLVDAMYETMREAPGVGLAAPQCAGAGPRSSRISISIRNSSRPGTARLRRRTGC